MANNKYAPRTKRRQIYSRCSHLDATPMARLLDCGVYEIVHIESGKKYIGSAKQFRVRFTSHRTKLRANTHHCKHLQSAWNLYGPSAFRFTKLLLCEPAELVWCEQQLIDSLQPEYNSNPRAGSSIGVKFSDATKRKIGDSKRGKPRSKLAIEQSASKLRGRALSMDRRALLLGNTHALGKPHTEEMKAAQSLRQTGKKRPPRSAEWCAKLSATLKGVPHTLERRKNQAAAQRGLQRAPYTPMTQETRDRIAAIRASKPPRTGRKLSATSIAKMVTSLTGRELSAEHKAHIGAASRESWRKRKLLKP